VHYPYDLIKCRLQSKNYIFKYKNLPHAFKKEIKNNGITSLYSGASPFLATYVAFICLQFTIYEVLMKQFKTAQGEKKFKENEMKYNLYSSLVAGCVSAAITNPLECITVNKQTSSNFNIREFIKAEGLWNICIKGLLPRVAYNGF
tara:strand:+ start:302 stop:739 length:438 start_codon:yes stop_codon:yes gene_type:complete